MPGAGTTSPETRGERTRLGGQLPDRQDWPSGLLVGLSQTEWGVGWGVWGAACRLVEKDSLGARHGPWHLCCPRTERGKTFFCKRTRRAGGTDDQSDSHNTSCAKKPDSLTGHTYPRVKKDRMMARKRGAIARTREGEASRHMCSSAGRGEERLTGYDLEKRRAAMDILH